MKKVLYFILCLCIATMSFSQKPSKEQMEADRKRLAEAKKQLEEKKDAMDPKARKSYDSLLNSLGVTQKMDDAVKQVNSNSTTKTGAASAGLVPAKNTKAIAAIAPTPTPANMGAFVATTGNSTFAAVLPAAKNKANEIYEALKKKQASPDEMGNAAVVLWMQGRTQVALCMMAQVCKDNPANSDHLNNYASMLSMMGAPELAIPILNNLNKKFKNNSTVLNNLGQAWFALGDTDKAKKYLDSTLLLFAAHPQANETLCLIAQSKGNKTAAVSYARSAFKHSYSNERAGKLSQLGYTPGAGDYNSFPPDNKSDDLLNLGGFTMPPFPRSLAEQTAYDQEWKQFRAAIDKRQKVLQKISDESNQKMMKRLEEQQQQFMAARNKTIANPGSVSQSSAMQIVGAPLFSMEMNARENRILENLQRKKQLVIQRIAEFKKNEGAAARKKYDATMKSIAVKWGNVGEGGTENNEKLCRESVAAADAYLNTYNTKLEELYNEYLGVEKQLLNEMSYSALYTTYPELLPGINAGLQIRWLNDLAQQGESLQLSYGCTGSADAKQGKLTEFKDPNCTINSEFGQSLGLANLGFSIKLDCSGITTKFNALIVGITLNQDLDHAGFGDSYKSCTVSIGPKTGVEAKFGPVEASGKVGAGVDIEIDRNGISDVVITAGAEAEAGSAMGNPVSASAGVEGRISLNTGAGSIEGTGIFKK